jgi:hypothetical protein
MTSAAVVSFEPFEDNVELNPGGLAAVTATPHDAALEYVTRGLSVIPLWSPMRTGETSRCSCPRGTKCKRIGKHPLVTLVPQGLKQATLDPVVVSQWWERFPRANVAIVLGERSGMWALDVDPRHGGDRELEALCDRFGELPETFHVFTGGGGDHYFFRWPGRHIASGCAHHLGDGLDVKAEGGYVVAPPSLHACGERYVWDRPTELHDAPSWILERIPSPRMATAPTPRPAGRALPRAELAVRAVAYLAAMPEAIEGQHGSDATMRAARALVRGFNLSPEDAFDLLWHEYNPRCRPPWPADELRRKIDGAARSDKVPRGYLLDAKRAP